MQRNVMAKIELHVEEVTPLARANAIRSKILVDDQIQKFVDFVYHGYLQFCDTKKKLHFHYRNRDRDVAIIALVLSGGFRVSEIVNLNLQNVVLEKNQVLMIRKGKRKMPHSSVIGERNICSVI
ncbi:hypothetical protein ACLMAB_08410 [Brevibacillus laterosporus]